MLSESEKIAIRAVVGIAGIIDNRSFEDIIAAHPEVKQWQMKDVRDKIDALVKKENDARITAEFEASDLRYQLKELLLRIEERRDIRNDLLYKDLKKEMNVA